MVKKKAKPQRIDEVMENHRERYPPLEDGVWIEVGQGMEETGGYVKGVNLFSVWDSTVTGGLANVRCLGRAITDGPYVEVLMEHANSGMLEWYTLEEGKELFFPQMLKYVEKWKLDNCTELAWATEEQKKEFRRKSRTVKQMVRSNNSK